MFLKESLITQSVSERRKRNKEKKARQSHFEQKHSYVMQSKPVDILVVVFFFLFSFFWGGLGVYKRVCDLVCISLLLYIAFSVPLRAFLRLSRFYLEVVFPTKDQFHQDLIKNISCVLWRSWLLSWKPLFFSVICKSTSSNGKWHESHLAPQEPQRRRKWKPTKKVPSVNKQRWVLIKQRKEERYQSEWLSASSGLCEHS